jgi:hypothetical protein
MLVIIAALARVYDKVGPKGIDVKPYQMLAAGAADETAKLLHNSGSLILVDADFGPYKILAPTTESEIKAFKKSISGTGLKIAGIEKVAITKPSLGRVGIFMRPGQLEDLMARHADADAIVLFVGLAEPDDVKKDTAGNKSPKLILVSNYEPADSSLLEKGILQLAIAPKLAPDADEDKTIHSGKEWFEQHYEVLTP